MRVLIFCLTYHPFIGGAEIAVREITERITSPDVSFDMITLRFDRSLPSVEKIGNVTVHRIGFTARKPTMADLVRLPLIANKYLFPFAARQLATRLHAEKPFDMTWSIMANYAGFAALFFKRAHPSVPFALTLQEGDPAEYIKKRVGLLYPLYRSIFGKVDSIQAISQYLASYGTAMGHTKPVRVVPNGVDAARFGLPVSFEDKQRARERMGVPSEAPCLITTSRLVNKNAVDDVIRAIPLLPQSVHFAIIGAGPLEHKLRALSKDTKVADRIHFVGEIPYAELPPYLATADIFIRPSRSEGMGNAFIEAMAAGIPVIGTAVGGITDFLSDPTSSERPTGLICDVNDPTSIAKQALLLLTDCDLRKRLVANARALVSERYEWSTIAKDMEQFLRTTANVSS